MNVNFSSVFSNEIVAYLNLLQEKRYTISGPRGSLHSFDQYLTTKAMYKKTIEAKTITEWIKTRTVSSKTIAHNISHIRGFVRYLNSLGFVADCPDTPKTKSHYQPYTFSDEEIKRMFFVADNFSATKYQTHATLVFPILLRILYGCGLRLGEGLSLRWSDVDFEIGILTILQAKNQKQRFVPMNTTLTEVLKKYKRFTDSGNLGKNYLFESNFGIGKPFDIGSFGAWFEKVLKVSDIHYVRKTPHERGICPHCLRHNFTLKSFLKSEKEGRCFEDTAPFLTAYLGHTDLKGTETYLSSNYLVYAQSHKRVDSAIGHLFPEVNFDEE